MSHLHEGVLRALLDEELPAAEADDARNHLAVCAACGAALQGVEQAQARTTALLAAADVPAPTDRVRARLAELRAAAGPSTAAPDAVRLPVPARRGWIGRRELAKAALLVLGFSGAVAAAVHPASPLRRWLAGEAGVAPVAVIAEDAPTAARAAGPVEVGVRLTLATTVTRIDLVRAAPGTVIEVTWVDGNTAAVYAPEGSTFTTSDTDGRIDAMLAAGPVRVEMPRGSAQATLRVNALLYLEKTGERIDYPGPPALVEGSRVRFEAREPTP